VVIYYTFKNFGNIDKDSYGPIISNTGGSYVFGNKDNSYLLSVVGKSTLR
jgi:hypothetical protein